MTARGRLDMGREKTEILIVGAGILGLTVARELIRRGADRIVILEKEAHVGLHASGRNSGILHGGVYYTPDSLKAKSCLRGNMLMKAYCAERGIPCVENGKVIVTSQERDIPVLEELERRARANGATVEVLDERSLSEVEPGAKTVGKALWVKNTAAVDPRAVLKALVEDLIRSRKVSFRFLTRFEAPAGSCLALTTTGALSFDYFINTAGAYSDIIAHKFGLAEHYRLVPFKGIYRKLDPQSPLAFQIRGNIYPVPDLRNPFLGVHFSRNVRGEVYVGPTAMPAFGREHYGILRGIDREALRFLWFDCTLFLSQPSFRRLALTESAKYLRSRFYKDAAKLVRNLSPKDLLPSDKSGIRPQLVNTKTKSLEMDFLIIRDNATVHVLNPISPAFTSSMDLAEKICDALEGGHGHQARS